MCVACRWAADATWQADWQPPGHTAGKGGKEKIWIKEHRKVLCKLNFCNISFVPDPLSLFSFFSLFFSPFHATCFHDRYNFRFSGNHAFQNTGHGFNPTTNTPVAAHKKGWWCPDPKHKYTDRIPLPHSILLSLWTKTATITTIIATTMTSLLSNITDS